MYTHIFTRYNFPTEAAKRYFQHRMSSRLDRTKHTFEYNMKELGANFCGNFAMLSERLYKADAEIKYLMLLRSDAGHLSMLTDWLHQERLKDQVEAGDEARWKKEFYQEFYDYLLDELDIAITKTSEH